MKKMLIDKKMYDVIDEQEYCRRIDLGSSNVKELLMSDTAVLKDGNVYPILPTNAGNVVGMYDAGPMLMYTKPHNETERDKYSSENLIDFDNNADGLKGAIELQAKYDAAERSVLISKDNIYNVPIREEDSPEMKLFKEALNKKSVDIMSYKPRFSSDFSNDTRVIQGDSITFGKLKKLGSILDMEIELTIRDKKGAVNPIGEELSVIIND